ncbi:MAG: ATP-binding protein [Erysipelotrichia bacterium]|nr:ATP-binding protein [Erysipelotrichia bacterium]
MIIITNLTFDKWPGLFGDTILTAAMVDRLTNKANVVQIISESYRIIQTNQRLKPNLKK